MSNRVTIGIKRSVTEYGYFSFSTKHDSDLVDKWVDQKGSDMWVSSIDQWEEPYISNTSFCDETVFQEGKDEDECPYDNQIQKWINEQK